MLAAEYQTMTGNDPLGFGFVEPVEDERAPARTPSGETPKLTLDGRSVDELRKTWGLEPRARAGTSRAIQEARRIEGQTK